MSSAMSLEEYASARELRIGELLGPFSGIQCDAKVYHHRQCSRWATMRDTDDGRALCWQHTPRDLTCREELEIWVRGRA